MKTSIVFYSLTGNNKSLAESMAKKLKADIIEVKPVKKFSMGTLILDIIFKRSPKVTPEPKMLDAYENIIFMGPLWMGQAATPLRKYFAYLKSSQHKYSYISVCGGAKGGNGNLKEQLEQSIGRAPQNTLELHTAGLVPQEVSDDIKATSDYKLTQEDVEAFTQKALKAMG